MMLPRPSRARLLPRDARELKRDHRPLIALALLAAGIVVAHGRAPAAAQSGFPPLLTAPDVLGRPAPDFTLPLLRGGTLRLSALRGHPVVLNFWASWCTPCRAETPLLVRVSKTYTHRGIVFVGVNVQDTEGGARQFVAQYRVDYTVVRAPERLMDDYAVAGLPTTVFVGASGVVAGKAIGGFLGPAGERDLAAHLDHLLGSGSATIGSDALNGTGSPAARTNQGIPPWASSGGFLLAVLLLLGARAWRARRSAHRQVSIDHRT